MDDELASLGRIVACIKEYCRQTDCYDIFNSELVDLHLKNHLIMADYLFWQYLQVNKQDFSDPLEHEPKDSLSPQEFELLLREYRRSVYEKFHQFWSKPEN